MTDEIKAPVYSIDLKIGNQAARRYVIKGRTTIGKSQECDICVDGTTMAPLHLALMAQDGVLSIIHLAQSYSIILDQQELEYGRSYILDRGDKLKIGEIEIIVRKDEVLTVVKNETEEEGTTEIKTQKISLENLMKQGQTGVLNTAQLKKPTILEKKQPKANETISEETEQENTSLEEIAEEATEETVQKQSGIKEKILVFKNVLFNLFKRTKHEKNERNSGPSNKTISKITIKKSAISSPISPPPTVVPRFYSLLLDLALVYGAKYFIIPFFDLETTINNSLPPLLETLNQIQTTFFSFLSQQCQANNLPLEIPTHFNLFIKDTFLTPPIVLSCILFIIIQLTSHLVTGNSLGLYLMAAKSNDSLAKSRIKAVFKCLIGFITLPFIIFDLPILFNKRSFKEFITFSDIEMKSRIQAFISGLIIIPALIIISLISPIFLSLEDINGPNLAQKEIQYKKLKQDEIPQIQLALADSDILIAGNLFPHYAQKTENRPPFIISTRQQDQIDLEVYDFLKKIMFKISFDNKIKIRPLIPYLSEGNPLFSYLHEKANYLTEDEKSMSNIESQTDIMEVIKSSFLLGEDSLISHILENGPFINGLVKFRRELYKTLEVQKPSDLELIKVEGHDYLSVTQTNDGPYAKIFFINLDFSKSEQLNYILTFKKQHLIPGTSLAKNFLQSLKKLSKKDQDQPIRNDLQKDFNFQKTFYNESQRKGKNIIPEIFFHEEDFSWWKNYLAHNCQLSLESGDQSLIAAQNHNLKSIANNISQYKRSWENLASSPEATGHLFSEQLQRVTLFEQKIDEMAQALKEKKLEYFSHSTTPGAVMATP